MGHKKKDGSSSRVRRRAGQALSLGDLASFQDVINARRLVLREVASGRMDHRIGNVLFVGLTGLRKDMEALQDANFESRIAAYEQAALSGHTLDRPADTTLQ
jgi:hypothetical protein